VDIDAIHQYKKLVHLKETGDCLGLEDRVESTLSGLNALVDHIHERDSKIRVGWMHPHLQPVFRHQIYKPFWTWLPRVKGTSDLLRNDMFSRKTRVTDTRAFSRGIQERSRPDIIHLSIQSSMLNAEGDDIDVKFENRGDHHPPAKQTVPLWNAEFDRSGIFI
jgi:hypothetical protein